ncbi:unnamed protein product [Psylliodes chrysocephalus]|uniref:Uncharacterized protein n=1 Tax=Psylliodes chrysocephalus TaxID=3402493 RepID=A0A9P0CP20_9CUCU|nr:unnamed protein product [Psylliodes chrysocephala]
MMIIIKSNLITVLFFSCHYMVFYILLNTWPLTCMAGDIPLHYKQINLFKIIKHNNTLKSNRTLNFQNYEKFVLIIIIFIFQYIKQEHIGIVRTKHIRNLKIKIIFK